MSDPTPQTTTPTTQQTAAPAKKSGPTLLQRITMIQDAWKNLADPEISYAGMKLADYTAAVKPYIDAQAAVEEGKVTRAAAVVTKNQADAASAILLNRVVAGIKASPDFGPNSALYRACGYIPNNERATPQKAVAGAPTAKKTSVSMTDRIKKVIAAWGELAPESKLGGLSLGEFQNPTRQSFDSRDWQKAYAAKQSSAISTRDAAAAAVRRVNQKVIAAVIINDGKASPIYRAMGYATVG